MPNECLFPDKNNELCQEQAFVLITRKKQNAPNFSMPVCIKHLNEITHNSLEVKELD
jgi:hypothetical protein